MASPVTTFGITQSLLTNSVNLDSTLDATTKASLLSRINELTRHTPVLLDFSSVDSVAGQASVADATKSIEVLSGATGNNRVEWKLMTFVIPVNISGGLGTKGFLDGHVGASPQSAVPEADISMQYRLLATDTWKAFDRNTVLEEISSVQFAADIADQGSNAALPTLNLIAQQV